MTQTRAPGRRNRDLTAPSHTRGGALSQADPHSHLTSVRSDPMGSQQTCPSLLLRLLCGEPALHALDDGVELDEQPRAPQPNDGHPRQVEKDLEDIESLHATGSLHDRGELVAIFQRGPLLPLPDGHGSDGFPKEHISHARTTPLS